MHRWNYPSFACVRTFSTIRWRGRLVIKARISDVIRSSTRSSWRPVAIVRTSVSGGPSSPEVFIPPAASISGQQVTVRRSRLPATLGANCRLMPPALRSPPVSTCRCCAVAGWQRYLSPVAPSSGRSEGGLDRWRLVRGYCSRMFEWVVTLSLYVQRCGNSDVT